jgi:hypothetical protein
VSRSLRLCLWAFLLLLPTDVVAQCTTSTLNGAYFYILGGNLISGTAVEFYTELGSVNADGNGNVSGQSTASTAGTLSSFSISGTYSVQANCAGTLNLTLASTSGTATYTFTFEIAQGGSSALLASNSSDRVMTGQLVRAVNTTATGCSNAMLTGPFAFQLQGTAKVSGTTTVYSDAGQGISDGNGNLTAVSSVANFGTGAIPVSGSGTYSVAANCSGTAQLTYGSQVANYKIAIGEGMVLFFDADSGTSVWGFAESNLTQVVIPQFVFGGGWYSALYFTNSNSVPVSFTVNFTNGSGAPLSVPSVGGPSTQITLKPGGTANIQALDAGALNQGYATFTLPAGVTGYGVFRQSVSGVPDQEAVVPFSSAIGTSSTLTFDDTSNLITGVAIVNPSSTPTTVSITAVDAGGNSLGTSSLALAAFGQTALVLSSLSGLSGLTGQQGSVQFSVPQGNVAVLGLRFNGAAFTSIPTTQQ